jgi:hypothetical protein
MSMASTPTDQQPYPRLHVEIHRLSDTAVLVDGWLVENAKGQGRTAFRFTGSMDEARQHISTFVAKHGIHCRDEDIVIH